MQEAEVAGEVRTVGTHIGGVLALGGAIFRNPETSNKSDAMALNLENATVDLISLTDVSLPDEGFTADGGMELSSASIRVLSVGRTGPANRLPRLSGAQGWTLDAVNGSLRTDRTSARDWLDTIPIPPRTDGRKEFAAQPWKELAKSTTR